MRLLKMHVDNFGRLHDFNFNFEEGLNVILEENGWGKTTMAAFLKAMLYGLEPGSFDRDRDRDRKRYRPWQGGTFGGSLDIEVNGENYRITRIFGNSLNEDKVAVVNLATGKPAPFDAEHLGEELFHLDGGAFERSAFIRQNGLLTEDSSAGIQARLSSLISEANAASSYEKASGDLDQKIRALERADGRGEIDRISRALGEKAAEKAEIERFADKQQELRSTLYLIDDRIRQADEEIKKETQKHDEAVRNIQKRSANNDLLKRLNDELSYHEKSQEAITRQLGGSVPTKKQLEESLRLREVLKAEDEQTRKEREQRNALYSDVSVIMSRFRNQLPSDAKLEEISVADKELHSIEFAMEQEEKRFSDIQVPQGYTAVQNVMAHNPRFANELKEAVGLQEQMRNLSTRSKVRATEIRGEEESWKSIQRGYEMLHNTVEKATQNFAEMKGYSAEETGPDIQKLDELKDRETAIQEEAESLMPLIEKEDSDWTSTKKTYDNLHVKSKKLKKALDNNEIYSPAQVEEAIEKVEELQDIETDIKERKDLISRTLLTDEEKKKIEENKGEIPEAGESETMLKRYKTLKDKEEYRNNSNEKLDKEKARAMDHIQAIKNIDQAISEIANPGTEPSKGIGTALLVIGLIVLLGGAALAYFVKVELAAIGLVGIVLIALGIMSLKRSGEALAVYKTALDEYNQKKTEKEQEKEKVQNELNEIEGSIKTMSQELAKTDEQIEEERNKITKWITSYGKGETELSEETITKIGERTDEIRDLRAKENKLAENKKFIEEKTEYVKTSLSGIAKVYRDTRGMDVDGTLKFLRRGDEEYEKLEKRYNTAAEEEESFLAKCGFTEEMLKGESPVLPSEARKRYAQLTEDLKEIAAERDTINQKYKGISNLGYDAAAQELTARTEKYAAAEEQLNNAVLSEEKYLEESGQTAESIVKPESSVHADLIKEKQNDEALFANLLAKALGAIEQIGFKYHEGANVFDMLTKAQNYSDEYERYSAQKTEYQNNIARQRQDAVNKKAELDSKLEFLKGIYDDLPVTERLTKVQTDRANVIHLAETIKDLENKIKTREEGRAGKVNEITTFDHTYGVLMNQNSDVFSEISAKAEEYWKDADAIVSLQKQLEELKQEIVKVPDDCDEAERDSALAISRLKTQKDLMLVERTKADARIREIDRSLEQYPQLDREIRELVDEKEKAVNELRLLRKASNLLRQARENLSGRYYNRVEELFNDYMRVWLNSDAIRAIIDEDLTVSIEENNKTRGAQGYSAGYCDLMDVCMRMALVDTLFENEKPFLILDDPFVNLDEDRLKGAMELLNAVAETRQIIYFVCHSVRAKTTGLDSARKEEFRQIASRTQDLQHRRAAEKRNAARFADYGRSQYQVTGALVPFVPADPQMVIRETAFRLGFVLAEDGKPANRTYELFFIAEDGSVVSNRKLVEISHGEIVPDEVKFMMNLPEHTSARVDLIVKEVGTDDFEIGARFPFRVLLTMRS